MQFMVKDKSKFFFLFWLSLLIIYIAGLVFDRNHSAGVGLTQIAFAHQKNIVGRQFDNLILGGSNGAFSLSANDLELVSGESWYNLSIMNEGFSAYAYHEFIRSALSKEQREKMRTVVYSSIQLFNPKEAVIRMRSRRPISGGNSIGLTPRSSIWRHTLNCIRGQSLGYSFPLPLKNGDFDFDKFICPESKVASFNINIKRTHVTSIANYIANNIHELRESFPNARIVIVFPSVYSNGSYPNDLFNSIVSEVASLQSGFDLMLSQKVHFVFQPFFPNRDYVCGVYHHANKMGREWRTTNLWSEIMGFGFSNEPFGVRN